MSLLSAFGMVRRRTLWALHRRIVSLGERGPIVSFAFDDFPHTAYTAGGSILKSCGVRGTYYAAIGLMGASSELGEHFRPHDLHSLLADGHELANHTFSHISCRSVPLFAFRQDVRKGQEAICRMTGIIPSAHFAYPYGEVTLAAKKALSEEMMSCRGICGGVNGPNLDLNLLRANGLYGGVDRCPQVEQLVSDNDDRKGWLIFYTHDVRDNHSPYGCTPALLKATLSIVIRRGAKILPVAEVVSDLSRHRSLC